MTAMEDIKRIEVDEFWADSTVVEAGGFVFVGYCMRNEGQDIRAREAMEAFCAAGCDRIGCSAAVQALGED